MAFNVITKLESLEEVTHVHFASKYRAAYYDVLAWEETNAPYRLPEDMRLFYTSSFNGMELRWTCLVMGKPVVIGEIKVNDLKSIVMPTVAMSLPTAPDGSDYAAVFVLYAHPEAGDLLLVFNRATDDAATSIWYRDAVTNECSYVCASFTHLLRLMVVHLGIIGWPRAFAPGGLSPATQAWMLLFCKERLCVDRCGAAAGGMSPARITTESTHNAPG